MMSRVGLNLRASAYLHQGDRKYMEDEFQVAYQRSHDKKDIEYAFFGIFDGHGGKEAAHFAKDNLMDNIVSQRLFWSENDEDVLCAIKEGFLQTHMAMWKELDQWPRTASGWPSTSGTTASIAFIRRQKIYIGHVGDSGIVLGKNLGGCDHSGGNEWFGIYLTRDHKPESVLEMNRITECGGKVIAKSGVPRVVWNRPKFGHQGPVRRSTPMDEIPFLAVARSLGDLWSYNASNNQFVVSPEPDVCVFDIDINHHRCLIFGTDGLWNALSPSQAVNIAYNSEKNNEKHYLGVPMGCGKQRLWINPSRCIVSGALERYQLVNLRADNTSAVTVYLDPPGRPKREVLLQQLSMKKGSQSKNASPKSPSKKLKEASVNVHVHNQPSSTEGNRGILWIKERLPEGKPNRTSPPLVIPHHSWPGSLSSSSVSSATREDSRESRTGAEENSNATSACSECGCTKRSSPGHTNTNLSTSMVDLNCKPVPTNCNGTPDNHCISGTAKASSGSSNKNDDIQIPLVSSSTYIEGSEDDREISTSAPASNKPPYRRTRSCVSHSATDCNENKKDITHPPTASSTSSSTSGSKLHLAPPSLLPTYQTDTSHRVLKNINRGSSCLKVDSNSSSGLISTKRKRARDILHQEERSSKSLRVHTRSHTMRSKPMITRSQGKTNVQRRSL